MFTLIRAALSCTCRSNIFYTCSKYARRVILLLVFQTNRYLRIQICYIIKQTIKVENIRKAQDGNGQVIVVKRFMRPLNAFVYWDTVHAQLSHLSHFVSFVLPAPKLLNYITSTCQNRISDTHVYYCVTVRPTF